MGGYSDLKLNDRVYEVSFNGNGYTSSSQVYVYTLLRASELAIENEYSHFVIMDDASSANSYTARLTDDRVEHRPDGYGGVTSTVRPGATMPVNKYASSVRIFLFNDYEDEENELLLEAVDAESFWEENKPHYADE